MTFASLKIPILANIHDPDSVKAVYPYPVYEADCGHNSAVSALRRGLRIEAAADANGSFRLRRASHPASADGNGHGGVFLCPYMGRAYGFFALRGGARGAVEERRDIFQGDADEYERFIDRVIEAARNGRAAAGIDPQG